MADVWVKQGDTSPIVRAVLRDGAGDPVDLAGTTIRFLMREMRSHETIVDEAASLDQVSDGSDGTLGHVSYEWADGDTAEVGGYDGEFEVTFSSGEVETFPNSGYLAIAIVDDLEGS